MTNTIDRKSARAPKSNGRESAVGRHKHKRTPTDIGLALITPIVGQEFLDRHNLRDPLNRGLQVRRQAGLLRRRRHHPPVQDGVRGQGWPDPTEGERSRLLRPDPRRRPEDDRRDRRRVRRRGAAARRPRSRRNRKLSGRSRREGQRTGHHGDQHPRGFRRDRRTPRRRDERVGRRGTRLRGHGIGAADPGARRCRIGPHPLGQRRPAGHLSQGVRRRERAAGVPGDRRAARRCSTRPR